MNNITKQQNNQTAKQTNKQTNKQNQPPIIMNITDLGALHKITLQLISKG